MKPYLQLAEARLPDGTKFTLHAHDGKFYLKNDGHELMSTALTHSEQVLAEAGCAHLLEGDGNRPKHPHILIGGLGMGFTLKRTLELVGRPATIEVSELVPEVIEWNRTFLVEHNGPLLDDPRTRILQKDLFQCLDANARGTYDAILIDIDDGPDALVTEGNDRLYQQSFLQKTREALAPGGRAAYWLAVPMPSFAKSLWKAGFQVEELRAGAHARSKRARHAIYLARPR